MPETERDLPYRLIRSIFLLASWIPRKVLSRLAYPLGGLWYLTDPYHRKIAFDNMISAFGNEMDPARCRCTVRATFVQLFRVALELPSLMRLNTDNLDAYVVFSGEEHLKQALAGDRGVLILTAHLGNWELMALAFALKFNLRPYVMVRSIDYPPMDRMLTELRTRTGNHVLDKDKSAGIVRELLIGNQIIGILLDQNASWYEGVYVPFFGRVACTNKGLAMFALRYGATVLPTFNVRQKDGRYRIMFDAPVTLIRTGDVGRDIVENTEHFNTIIEKFIRMAPDNWLWVHRRWRIKDIPKEAQRKIKGYSDLVSNR